MPNTKKFMDRMIHEYKTGMRSDKNVCQSIRNITRINERQWSYDYQKIADKIATYSPEQYIPGCDEQLEEIEKQDMNALLLERCKLVYGNDRYQDMLSTPEEYREKIKNDIANGVLGEDIRAYFCGG